MKARAQTWMNVNMVYQTVDRILTVKIRLVVSAACVNRDSKTLREFAGTLMSANFQTLSIINALINLKVVSQIFKLNYIKKVQICHF